MIRVRPWNPAPSTDSPRRSRRPVHRSDRAYGVRKVYLCAASERAAGAFVRENSVQWTGYPCGRIRPRKLRAEVGLVFQYPEHQLFETDVLTDVKFGPKNLGLSPDEQEERATESAPAGRPERKLLHMSPFELSGGEKRRAAIAGVLAMHPGVLILDEPTAGLDPRGRDEIMDLVSELHAAEKKDDPSGLTQHGSMLQSM
jgi:energy-coupling factor transporter ATP-binding protein EcfA2